jgi:hypothetical protein
VTGHFWDIGRVLLRNFDWLPFTPSDHLLWSFNEVAVHVGDHDLAAYWPSFVA